MVRYQRAVDVNEGDSQSGNGQSCLRVDCGKKKLPTDIRGGHPKLLVGVLDIVIWIRDLPDPDSLTHNTIIAKTLGFIYVFFYESEKSAEPRKNGKISFWKT